MASLLGYFIVCVACTIAGGWVMHLAWCRRHRRTLSRQVSAQGELQARINGLKDLLNTRTRALLIAWKRLEAYEQSEHPLAVGGGEYHA